jgi:hypothetical protein
VAPKVTAHPKHRDDSTAPTRSSQDSWWGDKGSAMW